MPELSGINFLSLHVLEAIMKKNGPIELWNVYIYLRKSRKDEQHIDEPIEVTLSRHQDTLNRVAIKQHLNVVKVYKEVETGDSIAARPMMLELMADVEEGLVDAVLVMDIDRLGRGDLQDQGYILNLFKRQGVKIITPDKTYDLDDEGDEDMFDFKAFFARKELVTIKRRFRRGKQASLNAGNYIGTNAPFGYRKEDKTLFIVEEEADIVRMMFDLYVNHGYGDTRIARHLNSLGIKSRNGIWERTTIRRMVNNPIYIGKIAWNKRKFEYRNGKRVGSTLKPLEEWDLYEGRHEAIVDEETFWRAQELAKERIVPHSYSNTLSNPLSYIIKCGACGYTMSQRSCKNKKPSLRCHKHCGGVMSTYIEVVEERLLEQLRNMLQDMKWEYERIDLKSSLEDDLLSVQQIKSNGQKEIEKLKAKRQRQYDLLEEGIYSNEEFMERSRLVASSIERQYSLISEAEEKLQEIEGKIKQSQNVLPQVISAIDFIDNIYWSLDAEHKNEFLCSIVDHVNYYKPKGSGQQDFKLEVYLKL